MNSTNNAPIYNLKAVVQETGIKPDTLRAWERRYDLPKPQRTASGHRLYSQRDIDMLHWLMSRQEEGLSISRAIEMWQYAQQQGEETGNGKTAHLPDSLSANWSGVFTQPTHTPSNLNDKTIVELTRQWVQACMNFDQPLADQALSQAFAMFPTELVCTRLIQQGLAQIGEGWYHGTVTVQQEHFASSLAVRRMETMLTATPDPTRSGRILIGNPPSEEHTFVPLMLSLLLRRRGWDVVYLGANVPIASLDATIVAIKPNLIILTAQQLHTAATLFDMSHVLLQERIPLAFGGLVFNQIPDLSKQIPGYFLGENLENAVKVIEQIMASLRVKSAQRAISQEYRAAFLHFQERRSQLEAAIWHQSAQIGIAQRDLIGMNQRLGDTIAAALQLGDIHYVEPTLSWIESTLVQHHHVPPANVANYFDTYALAVQQHLGEPGQLLRQWFAIMYEIETEQVSYLQHQQEAL